MTEITAELFRQYTGREPQDDDLERCNCTKRGAGHTWCGWNISHNAPRFEVGDLTKEGEEK